MGCGCGGNKVSRPAGTSGVIAGNVPAPMFDVQDAAGAIVASYSNPVTARSEARRVGGVVVDSTRNASATPAEITAAPLNAATGN